VSLGLEVFRHLEVCIPRTVGVFFNVLSIFQSLQGKNLKDGDEFDAIGDMLSAAKWDLPAAQEYKNDLVQPCFPSVEGVPKAASQNLAVVPAARPDPEGPATDEQWKKVNKMVA